MNKAVFLDRDGTINVEKEYLYKISDFEFLPGVIEGLKLLQSAGYMLIIITNQSGIARGYYTEEKLYLLNNWMLDRFKENGIDIDAVFYCPHLPDAKIEKYRRICSCRKPSTGLFEEAIAKYNIDVNMSFAIGDKIRDCCICENTNCKGYLVEQEQYTEEKIKIEFPSLCNKIKCLPTLLDCAKEIVNNIKCNGGDHIK